MAPAITEKTLVKVTRKGLEEYTEAHREALVKSAQEIPLSEAEARALGSLNDYVTSYYGEPSRADLSGLDLSLVNLRLADLSETKLHQVKFPAQVKYHPRPEDEHALEGVIFQGADLTGAELSGAILAGLDLTGTNLTAAKLNGVDATKTDFTGAIMIGAEAKRATLRKTILNDTDLTDFTATLAIIDRLERDASRVRFHFDDVLDESRRRSVEDGEDVVWISEKDETIAALAKKTGGVQQRLGWEDRMTAAQGGTPSRAR